MATKLEIENIRNIRLQLPMDRPRDSKQTQPYNDTLFQDDARLTWDQRSQLIKDQLSNLPEVEVDYNETDIIKYVMFDILIALVIALVFCALCIGTCLKATQLTAVALTRDPTLGPTHNQINGTSSQARRTHFPPYWPPDLWIPQRPVTRSPRVTTIRSLVAIRSP